MKLILASASTTRQTLLRNAGLDFSVIVPDIDEPALRASWTGPQTQLALALAHAKAAEIARLSPHALIIGADQLLLFESEIYAKPATLAQAAQHLRHLAGKTHTLITSVAVHQGGAQLWHHTATARLTMRPLAEPEIQSYLESAGPRICACVGAYQLEGPGINLFDAIDGDYFTILGLPLLPLLGFLRAHAAAS